MVDLQNSNKMKTDLDINSDPVQQCKAKAELL